MSSHSSLGEGFRRVGENYRDERELRDEGQVGGRRCLTGCRRIGCNLASLVLFGRRDASALFSFMSSLCNARLGRGEGGQIKPKEARGGDVGGSSLYCVRQILRRVDE